MYEESLAMPFIIRWPGVVKAGSRFKPMIQNIDYAPTFLEIAGLMIPPEIQGRSFVSILKGQIPDDWRKSVYYHYYEFPQPHRVAPHRGVRTEQYKLVHYYRTDEWECFDLKTDPQEMRSVYADPSYAEKARHSSRNWPGWKSNTRCRRWHRNRIHSIANTIVG